MSKLSQGRFSTHAALYVSGDGRIVQTGDSMYAGKLALSHIQASCDGLICATIVDRWERLAAVEQLQRIIRVAQHSNES